MAVVYNLKELLFKKSVKEKTRITLTEIAETVGISKNTIYRMANSKGGYNVRADVIEKLCKHFECTPNDLMTIVPDPQADEKLSVADEGKASDSD